MIPGLNPEKMIKSTAQTLIDYGMDAEEARRQAEEQVHSMGIYKIHVGQCPIGTLNPVGCQFCEYGHMTECHYPHTCEEAECSHYKAAIAAEGEEIYE